MKETDHKYSRKWTCSTGSRKSSMFLIACVVLTYILYVIQQNTQFHVAYPEMLSFGEENTTASPTLFTSKHNMTTEVTSSIIPEVTSSITSEMTSSIKPEVSVSAIPKVTSVITPEITSSIKPQVTSVTPSIMPEVNPHNYQYIILEDKICDKKDNKEVYLMVVICVAPGNFEHRHVIRNTWGSIVQSSADVRLVFILGKPKDNDIQLKIYNESVKNHDIVQENFIDSYRNLTLKSVAYLRWTQTFCQSAKYVLKVDDDMFINIPYLIGVLKHRKITNGIIGMVQNGARPIRDKSSKWYTPHNVFSEQQYPQYMSGTSYVISGDIVPRLYEVSLTVPFFWLEDVYITGLCRRKIRANAVNDFGFTYAKRATTGCAYRHVISGHNNTPQDILKIWKEITDSNLKCK